MSTGKCLLTEVSVSSGAVFSEKFKGIQKQLEVRNVLDPADASIVEQKI